MFDVDGVIAETPHEEAWKDAAVEWSIINKENDFTPFYAQHLSGEPGDKGARNILEKLKIKGKSYFETMKIKDNEKDDTARIFRMEVKQKYLNKYISEGRFKGFDDIKRMISEAKEDKIPIMVVSSSETSRKVLEKLGMKGTFEVSALGAKTHWNAGIDKINHYAMAYGKLLKNLGKENIEKVYVFEDAPKGINAVAKLGFYPIGVSRASTSGIRLASKVDLIEAGAWKAYNENELREISLKEIIGEKRA